MVLIVDTLIVPAERRVVDPVNALAATILRPATVEVSCVLEIYPRVPRPWAVLVKKDCCNG